MRRPRSQKPAFKPEALIACLGVIAFAPPAFAQTPPPPAVAAAPGAPEQPAGQPAALEDKEIDIANLVTSAAKGVTTVQEAPAIITIITADEIRQRGYREFNQVLGSIPGWIDNHAEGFSVTLPMVRGATQAALFLRDGVSFFDPQFNVATFSRALPLELVKRVEVVTGPGGVLWGSNSFLGVVNMITKDAEDVNGLEVSAGYGDGSGDRQDFRAYALFGKAFFDNRLKVMLHASYENYIGAQFGGMRQFIASSPAPQPPGPALLSLYNQQSDFDRSWILNLDGKISFDHLSLYFSLPYGQLNYGLTFNTTIITRDLNAMGQPYPDAARTMWNMFERYGILEYRDRFFKEKLGLDAKAYYINFNRELQPRVFPSSPLVPGGLTFQTTSGIIHRYGATLDVDYSGPWKWNRLLAGAEVFHESSSEIDSSLVYPDDPATGRNAGDLVPIVCPLAADGKSHVPGCPLVFAGAAERTVVGLFVADQIRVLNRLTLDGGVRYQQGFGQRGYAPQILGSAAAVAQIIPDVHVKLNFSQGFRAPVFNDTDGNGAAVQFGGNPNLKVETSESFSAEINARLLRNVRKVRELQLRLDYAYTLLDNLIVITNGLYQNSGRRAINSVEFLGKLYLNGDHALTIGYTFLQSASNDQGTLLNSPRHWFTIGAVFNLVKSMLDVNANLLVTTAYQDPNRYPSGTATLPGGIGVLNERATDLSYDRLTPVALLQLGVRLRLWKDRLIGSAQFYNVLNQRYYYPDPFFDQAPTVETRPNLAPGFSFFTSLTFRPL